MNHTCDYCNRTETGTRDELVNIGWSFVDIRAPMRKYIKACPEHFDNMKEQIIKATKGTMKVKWSND